MSRRRRNDTGVQLRNHRHWVRTNKWAKFLANVIAEVGTTH
jgi:hypothetical protein